MESKAVKKIDEIEKAILQLAESKQASSSSSSSIVDEHQLLTQLLSQLESLKQDEVANQSEPAAETEEIIVSGRTSEVEDVSKDQTELLKSDAGIDVEEVAKQLKKVEKQNRTTHFLLSALIVLTIAWQISEVSILLKLKNGFSHPFKSVGSMVAGMLKPRRKKEEEGEQSTLLSKVNGNYGNGNDSSLTIPTMNLTGLMNGDEE